MDARRLKALTTAPALGIALAGLLNILHAEIGHADSSTQTGAVAEAKLPEAMVSGAIPIGAEHDGNIENGDGDPEDPPIEPQPCPYFESALHLEGIAARGVSGLPVEIGQAERGLSCIITILDKFITQGNRGDSAYFDDNYAHIIANYYLGGRLALHSQRRPSVPFRLPNGAVCSRVERFHDGVVLNPGWYCVEGVWYMDQSCWPVQPETVEAQCGDRVHRGFTVNFVKSSPISFLWDDDAAAIDEDGAAVEFSLNPGSIHSWCIWRGSARAPLLVYDPSHTGKVESATQLFGNWTFGGKKTASLGRGVLPEAWANGYEALATLDRDLDGVISGSELDPLALWFDENRDARTQPGEVKRLGEVDVVRVFYKNSRKDLNGRDLRLDIGFERERDGVRIQGSSVDWYSDTASSPLQLISRGFLSDAKFSAAELPQVKEAVDEQLGKKAEKPALNGVWSWRIAGQNVDSPNAGLLALTGGQNGELIGFSLNQRYFQSSPSKTLENQTTAFYLSGSMSTDESGKSLRWTSKTDSGSISTTAELSADQKTIRGKTTVYYSEDGRSKRVEYSWIGTKIR